MKGHMQFRRDNLRQRHNHPVRRCARRKSPEACHNPAYVRVHREKRGAPAEQQKHRRSLQPNSVNRGQKFDCLGVRHFQKERGIGDAAVVLCQPAQKFFYPCGTLGHHPGRTHQRRNFLLRRRKNLIPGGKFPNKVPVSPVPVGVVGVLRENRVDQRRDRVGRLPGMVTVLGQQYFVNVANEFFFEDDFLLFLSALQSVIKIPPGYVSTW